MDRVTFKSEKTLRELADRVYGTRHADAATRARVEAALLRANPHAADFEKLPDAAPIVVPNVEGIPATGTAHPLEVSLTDLIAQVKYTIGSAREALAAAATRKVTATAEAATYVQSKEYRSLAERELPKETVDKIVEDTKARAAQAKFMKMFQAKAMTQLEQDLMELGGVFAELGVRTIGSFSTALVAEKQDVKEAPAKPEPPARKQGKKKMKHRHKPR